MQRPKKVLPVGEFLPVRARHRAGASARRRTLEFTRAPRAVLRRLDTSVTVSDTAWVAATLSSPRARRLCVRCARGSGSAHRHLAEEARLDAVENLRQGLAGGGNAVVAKPEDGTARVGRRSDERGDARGQLFRPARENDLRRLDPLLLLPRTPRGPSTCSGPDLSPAQRRPRTRRNPEFSAYPPIGGRLETRTRGKITLTLARGLTAIISAAERLERRPWAAASVCGHRPPGRAARGWL